MMTTTLPGLDTAASQDADALARNPARTGPVLLATDGMELGDGPAIAARLLAERLHVPLHVVTVVEPAYEASHTELGPLLAAVTEEHRQASDHAARRYLNAVLGREYEWHLHVRTGRISREIADTGRELAASLIVLGATPHHRLLRALAGVRAAQVLRRSSAPVFSVPPDLKTLPRKAIAAVDFSPASIRAAQAALLVLGERATLTLIHVPEPNEVSFSPTMQLRGVVADLQAMAPDDVRIETCEALGEVADAVLAVADQSRADLIALGTHGPGLMERVFVGSVATRVMHLATTAVLVAPPPAVIDAMRMANQASATAWSDRPQDWESALDAFSRRNLGRAVSLDVYDRRIGAQVEARGCVLQGAAFDPHGRRVEIMLALAPNSPQHLTRTMAKVDSVAILTAPDDTDAALEVRHDAGEGQTVLRFTD